MIKVCRTAGAEAGAGAEGVGAGTREGGAEKSGKGIIEVQGTEAEPRRRNALASNVSFLHSLGIDGI